VARDAIHSSSGSAELTAPFDVKEKPPKETLTRNECIACITQYQPIEWLRNGAVKLADELIFADDTKRVFITNAFNIALRAEVAATNTSEQAALITLAKSLRYRAVIPFLAATIAGCHESNDARMAGACKGFLVDLDHPDTLRAHLLLNDLIPSNSVLRQGSIPVWTDDLPLFQRLHCLPVYLEIARNPDKYNWDEWVTAAVGALTWYTNDVAVAELKRAFQTMRYWERYWPYHNPGIDLYRGTVYMRLQRELIEGKRAMPPMPPPLLDE